MRAVRAFVLTACLLTLPVLDASPAHAVTMYAGAFTGAGGAGGGGCVSPGPCSVIGWSALCQMVRVDTLSPEPCSMTLSGVINLVVNVNGLLCTGSGSAMVVIRNSGGSTVASIPASLVAAGGDIAWAGLGASTSPLYAVTSEGAIHIACGFAIGSLAGTFLAGYNV